MKTFKSAITPEIWQRLVDASILQVEFGSRLYVQNLSADEIEKYAASYGDMALCLRLIAERMREI